MSESKPQWTPGPYLSTGTVVYALEHDGWRKGEEQFRNRIFACVQRNRDCPEEEAEAVARLWGAAPELVEALSDLLATLERHMPGLGANAKPGTPVAKARAALAKAGA